MKAMVTFLDQSHFFIKDRDIVCIGTVFLCIWIMMLLIEFVVNDDLIV